MSFIKKLDHNLWTAIIVAVISLISFAASSFLIATDSQDIPFGFLLSGGIIVIIHLISYLFVKLDEKNGTTFLTIIAMAMRLVITLASIILIFLMYYKWNIKLFNVFTFIGIYTIGIIVLCLSFIFNKDGKE